MPCPSLYVEDMLVDNTFHRAIRDVKKCFEQIGTFHQKKSTLLATSRRMQVFELANAWIGGLVISVIYFYTHSVGVNSLHSVSNAPCRQT